MSSALPKQVQKQMEELAELEKAMQAPAAPPEDGESEKTVEQEPQQSQEPVAEQQTTPEAKPEKSEWENKYQVLQGKYNAEVPRLHQQNKELTAQLQELQKQVAELAKSKEAPKVETPDRLVTAKDEENFGSDLIDVQRRVAMEVMREQVAPLRAEIAAKDQKINQLEQLLTRTQGDVTSMTFEQKLYNAIPDFDAVNTDPKWVAWLDTPDEYGDARRLRAEAAYNAGDVVKVQRFVELFKGTQAPAKPNAQRQEELNRQVAPPKTATPTANTPPGERVYTEAEMNRLWDKVTKLYTQGKNDEAASLEAELSAAYAQGRVR